MKTKIVSLFFLTTFALITGCNVPEPIPDPLAGWKIAFKHEPDQAIGKDCQDYIQSLKLSPEKGTYVAYIEFFEDGTGQHAERITVSVNKTDWAHVLIYDKNDRRIKTIKYVTGHSRS
jgi:hypothetical protein